MNRRGSGDDLARVLRLNECLVFDPRVVHRELEIINNDLHCAEMFKALFEFDKPVIVTEFGMRSYPEAEGSGSLGFGIVDSRAQALHRLPGVGQFIRARLTKGNYVRDENLQAREIAETRAVLDASAAGGAFACTFIEQIAPSNEDPRYDLDLSALSRVKTYENGHGTTYPDMDWEPKKSFGTVARFFAEQGGAK